MSVQIGQTFTRDSYHQKNTLVDFEMEIPPNNTIKKIKKIASNI